MELADIPLFAIVEQFLDLRVLTVQLIFESFLCLEEFGDLNLEFFALAAQDIDPAVTVAGLECYLLKLLVELLNPLLVDRDLRDV